MMLVPLHHTPTQWHDPHAICLEKHHFHTITNQSDAACNCAWDFKFINQQTRFELTLLGLEGHGKWQRSPTAELRPPLTQATSTGTANKPLLQKASPLSPDRVAELLDMCLRSTYFSYGGDLLDWTLTYVQLYNHSQTTPTLRAETSYFGKIVSVLFDNDKWYMGVITGRDTMTGHWVTKFEDGTEDTIYFGPCLFMWSGQGWSWCQVNGT